MARYIRMQWALIIPCFLTGLLLAGPLRAQQIPAVAWSRGIGEPLDNPGKTKVPGNIDDGYWQGAPVGGFGSGAIGRTYRGDFARWHLKVGVHKYRSIPSDVFAAFEQQEGGAPEALVLSTAKPQGGMLGAWNWNYPQGAGKYSALYPKAWFDFRPPSFSSAQEP